MQTKKLIVAVLITLAAISSSVQARDISMLTVEWAPHYGSELPEQGLTTSIVALVTDQRRDGAPVVGYGFSSIGRYAQGGLIRERFAPRLLAAEDLSGADGVGLDPFRAWDRLMAGILPNPIGVTE